MTPVKDFLIRDLFDISTGSLLKIKDVPDGSIPRISVRSDNNGILGYYDTEGNPDARHAENFISVNFFGNAFYHPYRASLEMKVHCLTLKACELTENLGLYLVTALNKVFAQQGYSYGEQLSSSDLKTQDLKISLPVTTVAMPDWAALETLLKVHGGAEMSKIDTSSWKKFKISELFEIRKVYGKPLSEYTEGKTPYVTGSEGNNGVVGYVSAPPEAISEGGCIAVDPIKGFAMYQPEPFVGRGFSGASINLLYNDNLTEETAMYVCAAIEKVSKSVAAYTNLFNSDRLKNAEISLPVTMKDVPDWDYMQERIAELEQERIAELEQYLVAAGLNDYTLTEDDLKVLSLSGSGRDEDGNPAAHAAVSKRTEQFVISNVFELHKGQRLTKADQIPGRTPFIGSTACDNGVTGYIGQAPIFEGNAITVSYNGSVGQVFYQEKPFWASDDINVLYLKDHLLDRELFGYLGASLYKAGTGFSYTFKWNIERMRDTMFVLPIQTDEFGTPVIDEAKVYHPDGYVPDWEYMAAYIRAMEKLVIRDVVDYKDEFIRQHRLAVAGSGV